MRVRFDPEANAAYIYLRAIGRGEAVRTVPVEDSTIMLDFDADDRLIGVEVLDARERLPVEVLAAAEKPPRG